MPVYLYKCEVTNEEFETEHSIKVELEECILCADKKDVPKHKPKKLIAGSTLGKVQLTGHELTAKTNEDVNKMRERLRTDENFHANIVGENTWGKMVR